MEVLLTLEKLFLWLMFYSIAGWIYETALCSVQAKKFINRGFLNGPYCPIYGCGAVLDVVVLGGVSNVFMLFILGVVLDCSLEYATSYAMEKLFHARWWDYSDKKLNINGRVCALGAVVFGLFSVVVVKYIQPAVERVTDAIPPLAMNITSAVLFASFVTDIVATVVGFAGFNERLHELALSVEGIEHKIAERVHGAASREALLERFTKLMNMQERRMMHAFPRLRSVTYDETFTALREDVSKERERLRELRRSHKKNG